MKPQHKTQGGTIRGSVLILICILCVGTVAFVQEVDSEKVTGGLSFVDEVKVTVVNVDVYVRDRQDRSVTGLKKEDFRLRQDGHERELTHFAAYTEEVITTIMAEEQTGTAPPVPQTADATPLQGESARDKIQPVHVVIYVDNENIRPHDRNRVLGQTRRFIDQLMQPHVQVMVVSAQRSAEIVQPFTNDSRAVQNALRSMNRTYGARVDDDQQRSRIIHEMQKTAENPSAANPQQALDLEERIRTYGEELSMELDYSMSTIREVMTTLAGLPGRKALIHVSNGLPAVPARDLIDWYGDIYQKTSALPMLSRFNRRAVYESLASTANAQGVTFYMMDATGLAGDGAQSAEYARPVDPMYAGVYTMNHQEPLYYLAEKTGGRAIVGSNEVTGLLEDLRNDLFTYYSLGYTLPSSGADTVHRIEVELPGHSEHDLVYRRTMVEKSLETQVQDIVVSGLMLALDDNPMGITLSSGIVQPASAEDRWFLPLEIKLPISSIAMLPEGDELVGRVVLFLANRDLKGNQSDIQRREFMIRIPSDDYEERRTERYVAEFQLLLNEGEHKVVIGVLDPVTRQTSFATVEKKIGTSGSH